MARYSMPEPAVDGTKTYHMLNNSLTYDSSVASSSDRGSKDDGGGAPSVDCGSVASLVIKSVPSQGSVRGDKSGGAAGSKNKVECATNIPPSKHYQQQYPHGYPVSGYPPGMMPPVMMPMQPGTLPPGMMPYMMPPSYFGCPPIAGGCYDYSCGHPEIKSVNVGSRVGSEFSVSTSDSSCSTMLCAEPCEGFAKLIRKTVGSVARGLTNVMDCGEELCDPVRSGGNSVGTLRSSSKSAPGTTPQDHAELLDKIDRLYRLVNKNEATAEALDDLKCLESSLLAAEEDSVPGDAKTGDFVEKIASLFEDPQINVTLSQMENLEQESIEAEADFQDAKKLQSQRLMKSVPAKSFQVKGSTASTKNEPVIDSMGFPVELSSDHLSSALSWESDFSSSNPFAANGARCVSSPVSVTSSLETPSCAWCGLRGSNANNVKKLKLCSACQSTYYCSSECQSMDWSNGHSETCQPVSEY